MTSTITRPPVAPTRPLGREERRRKARFYDRPGWLSYALLVVFFIAAVFPLWWSFVMASRQASDINAVPPVVIPGPNFIENVLKAFATVDFAKALLNSLIISGAIAVAVVFFSTLAGFAFAKLKFRGRNPLMVTVIATMAIPTQLGIIPLFMLVSELKLANSLWAVIIPGLVSAFGVFFMRQYLVDTIPDELIEAARMDGASMWGTFWHVAIPAARPAMAVLGLFMFMAAWTDFLWPLLVLGPKNPSVQTALAALNASGGHTPDYSMVLAGAIISIVPLLILFLFAGKQLIAGIMSGAVKG
ncbi:carbohydrate ABC transporter permease [Protaetiibacter sp. SSC-01]|uniref:carbohydrate ABC transporter permease n=1 Tax=Protaetiibacter sp. SSC-01 TaxID=2759943 RepID=UPI001656F446|nr:carbohydrate ABC transporter permease [Protaetiibacter sp. SSC-01]QNO37380.1 carbohydrate ABC transporter permease [Protaetiibacter sp. SSC-01]